MGEGTSQQFSMKAQDTLVGRIAASGVVLPLFDVMQEARNRATELAGGSVSREERLLVYAGSPRDGGSVQGHIYEVGPKEWQILWNMPGDNKSNMFTLSPEGLSPFKEGNMNMANILLNGPTTASRDGGFSVGNGGLFANEERRQDAEDLTIDGLRDDLVVAVDRWKEELKALTFGKTEDDIGALEAQSIAVLREHIGSAGQLLVRLDIIQNTEAYRHDLLENLETVDVGGAQKAMVADMVTRGDPGRSVVRAPVIRQEEVSAGFTPVSLGAMR
ncbi:MAG: hypothetical protein KDI13_05365 [Alphaproteobacteria bacterium]|nr:hypothetical protein [Alphaproteobacteria bacterium]